MAHVAVPGAGLGGTILAYELREKLGKEQQREPLSGRSGPFHEKFALQALGIDKLKAVSFDTPAE